MSLLALMASLEVVVVVWDGDSHYAETVPGVGNGIPSYVMARQRAGLVYGNIAVSGSVGFHSGYDPHPGTPTLSVLITGTNAYNSAQTGATVYGIFGDRTALLHGLGHRVIWTTCPTSTLLVGSEETERAAGNVLLNANADADHTRRADAVYDLASYVTSADTNDGTHAETPDQVAKWATHLVPIVQAQLALL
jgi:hypothetical protein